MEKLFDLAIVGGGYAGLAAANRAAQLGLEAVVLERGAEEAYPCNSRYAGGVLHVSYHNVTDPVPDLTRAIVEIGEGWTRPELASAMAGSSARAVDWLIAENTKAGSQYLQKLNIAKIASGGHSQGSISTFAFAGMDTRLTTTIHVAGGSFDGNGYRNLKKPTLYIGGSGDTLALSNTKRDYENTNNVPVFLTVIEGASHTSAARDGWTPIVAWLRWHLGDEVQRKSMFIGANCDFCTGKFVSQSKGW